MRLRVQYLHSVLQTAINKNTQPRVAQVCYQGLQIDFLGSSQSKRELT